MENKLRENHAFRGSLRRRLREPQPIASGTGFWYITASCADTSVGSQSPLRNAWNDGISRRDCGMGRRSYFGEVIDNPLALVLRNDQLTRIDLVLSVVKLNRESKECQAPMI